MFAILQCIESQAPVGIRPAAGTCLVLSSLHPLKEWSLQETRGGSIMCSGPHLDNHRDLVQIRAPSTTPF